MHPIIVSIIVALLFVIITIIIEEIMENTLGYCICDVSRANQYLITFAIIFGFNMVIEYTELNDLICSGNH